MNREIAMSRFESKTGQNEEKRDTGHSRARDKENGTCPVPFFGTQTGHPACGPSVPFAACELEYPDAWLRCEERRELIRVAAVSALQRSRNGRDLSPEAFAWALHWAAQEPLARPLTEGV